MKAIMFLISVLSVQGAFASNVHIREGKYNADTKAIELEVIYGGGCKEHKFHLENKMCLESYPVQCPNIQLVDETTTDHCRAIVYKTISLTLKETGLDDPYFNGASLEINSAGTSVKIKLPFNDDSPADSNGLVLE